MFTRSTIALAMILGFSASAFAQAKKPAHGSNPAPDLYDSQGSVDASDIDARIRMEILRLGLGATE
jgi:hypothetical protein